MADVLRMDFQGELLAQKEKAGSNWTGLVTPYADPLDWYIVPFPTYGILEEYAVRYGLKIVKEQEDEMDTSKERK